MDSPSTTPEAAAILTIDGLVYELDALSERARLLSLDYIRSDKEWQALQHRYRQFIAMETTLVNSLKAEVEQAHLEPVATSGTDLPNGQALLTIDGSSYDATTLPQSVRLYVDDLVRNNQERGELEFRLRQLDAARLGYLAEIRAELDSSGAMPLAPQRESA